MDPKDAVRVLVDERSKLIAYIWAIVRDAYRAEDLYQDVLINVMEHAHEIRDTDHLRSWARQTARFRAIDMMRRQRREQAMLSESVINLLDPHWDRLNELGSKETLDALSHCMDQLSPDARRLIEMRYREELSGKQVAERLGRKRQSVYMAMTRIYKTLARCIRDRTGEASDE